MRGPVSLGDLQARGGVHNASAVCTRAVQKAPPGSPCDVRGSAAVRISIAPH